MSDPREKLREAIARAILTPDESYPGENLFDTDWYERERALHRADCVMRTIEVNKDLVFAVVVRNPGEETIYRTEQRHIDQGGETDG